MENEYKTNTIPVFEFYRPVLNIYVYEGRNNGDSLFITQVKPVSIDDEYDSLEKTLRRAALEITKKYSKVKYSRWRDYLSQEYFVFIKKGDNDDDEDKEIYEYLTPSFYRFFSGLGIEFLQHPLEVMSKNGKPREWRLWFVRNPLFEI